MLLSRDFFFLSKAEDNAQAKREMPDDSSGRYPRRG